ncbi:hypothetical protein [Acinetobacter baumannii]|uniref:hypothetical protein n=1 Tax=Acinetobacter baumannii TaxID=470 RepID=UPI00044C27DB|nr:hypothetical protein [Acinetobacter baumannii]EXB36194.1 hypothetical protein J518_0460 [Acinetobacter baumannii 1419130]
MTDLNKGREADTLPEVAHLLEQCKHRDLTLIERAFVKGARYAWQEKAKAQEVPEGYALVSKDKLHEWYCMANRSEELGCPECYESRGYAHNLACELNEASESGAEG